MDDVSNGTINDDELTEFDHDPRERRKTISAAVDEQEDSPVKEQLSKAMTSSTTKTSRRLPELWTRIISVHLDDFKTTVLAPIEQDLLES